MKSGIEGVFETPRKFTWKSSLDVLRDREFASPPRASHVKVISPGFTPDAIQSMERCFSFKHHGCVNTAAFNKHGTLLVTGSDDRKLKIWRSSNFISSESIKLKHEIITGHESNIFHALVSSSVFGRVHSRTNERSTSKVLT